MCEVECGGLDIADRRNMHSCSVAVKALLRIEQEADKYRPQEQTDSLKRQVLVFSISHNQPRGCSPLRTLRYITRGGTDLLSLSHLTLSGIFSSLICQSTYDGSKTLLQPFLIRISHLNRVAYPVRAYYPSQGKAKTNPDAAFLSA